MKMSRFNVEHSDDGATLIMNARGGGILPLIGNIRRSISEYFRGITRTRMI